MQTTSYLARLAAVFSLFASVAATAGAATQDVQHKTFDIKGPGQIAVAAESSQISLTTWDQPQVDVTITRSVRAGSESREKELLAADKINMALDGSKVTVTLDVPREWMRWDVRRDYRIEIKAPANFSAGLRTSGGDVIVDGLAGGVDARTSGGSVRLAHIGNDVNARTSGGDITLDTVTGNVDAGTSGGSVRAAHIKGNAQLHTSGGNVSVDDLVGDLDAGTSGGNVSLKGVTGTVEAGTSGGNVSATLTSAPKGAVRLKTSGGNVKLALPADAAATIDARTVGGGIHSDFPLTSPGRGSSHMQGPINGGGPDVELRTTGGSISIVIAK